MDLGLHHRIQTKTDSKRWEKPDGEENNELGDRRATAKGLGGAIQDKRRETHSLFRSLMETRENENSNFGKTAKGEKGDPKTKYEFSRPLYEIFGS